MVSGSPVRRAIASIVKAQMASAGFPQLLVLQPLAQQRLLVLQESRVKLMQIVQKLVCVVFMELLRPLSLEWVSPEQVLIPLPVEERLRVCLDGPVDLSIISLPCIGRELMDAAYPEQRFLVLPGRQDAEMLMQLLRVILALRAGVLA